MAMAFGWLSFGYGLATKDGLVMVGLETALVVMGMRAICKNDFTNLLPRRRRTCLESIKFLFIADTGSFASAMVGARGCSRRICRSSGA